jgi:hypothetical protein
MEFRPTALLGPYVASFLSQGNSLAKTAILGVQHITAFFERTVQDEEAYALLQDIGNALAVDVQDMLNRSPNRGQALDTYIASLTELQKASQSQLEALEGRLDTAQDDRREKQRTLTALERQLRDAINNEDYTTAGTLQTQISDAREPVAAADAVAEELQTLVDVYEEVLEVSDTRLTAMTSNREVLIAGVKIVDVPGIADIGIIQGDGRRLRNTSGLGGRSGL